jgi:hypothetical protein
MKRATVNNKESFLIFGILQYKDSNTIKIKEKISICENFTKSMEHNS